MRFVAISDTHMAKPELPEGDVLLHIGDLTYQGTLPEISEAAYWLGEQKQKKGFKHVIVIAGNHDWLFQTDPNLSRELMKERGLVYIEDSGVTLVGENIVWEVTPRAGRITIYGSPWQPWFNDWAFNLQRGSAIRAKWNLIPENIDILITHGPPFGRHDGVVYPSGRVEPVGCEDLRDAVKRIRPKYHIFGHVHEGYGTSNDEYTTYINASICDAMYDPINPPIVFEFNK